MQSVVRTRKVVLKGNELYLRATCTNATTKKVGGGEKDTCPLVGTESLGSQFKIPPNWTSHHRQLLPHRYLQIKQELNSSETSCDRVGG
jgi:hypothetical protein